MQRLSDLIKKIHRQKEIQLKLNRLKAEGWEKTCHTNSNKDIINSLFSVTASTEERGGAPTQTGRRPRQSAPAAPQDPGFCGGHGTLPGTDRTRGDKEVSS